MGNLDVMKNVYFPKLSILISESEDYNEDDEKPHEMNLECGQLRFVDLLRIQLGNHEQGVSLLQSIIKTQLAHSSRKREKLKNILGGISTLLSQKEV